MLASACLFTGVVVGAHPEPLVLGWLEGAYLQPWGVRVRAKLDTGARTSSLDADQIMLLDHDGEPWVRFRLPYGKREGYPRGIVIERPLVRETLVKEHASESVPRYVVNLDICISGTTFSTPVSLVDRSNFNYPMILGRMMLQGKIVVDPSRTFVGSRSCFRAKRKKPATPQTK